MSHPTTAGSSSGSQAEMVEKIREAELNSGTRLEQAKKEAEAIVAKARESADQMIRSAEESSRAEKARILSDARGKIDSEVKVIGKDTDEQVSKLKKEKSDPPDLKKLVLSILEE